MAESLQDGIAFPLGNGVFVTRTRHADRLTLAVRMKTDSECILHWGLSQGNGVWRRPPDAGWPDKTTATDGQAVRTLFAGKEQGEREVAIHLDLPSPARNLVFVIHFPKENRWLKNGGGDFSIPLPNRRDNMPSPQESLSAWVPADNVVRGAMTLTGGDRLAVATVAAADAVRVHLVCEADPPLFLHWGIASRFRFQWQLPPEQFRPAGTTQSEGQAVRTPFAEREGKQYLELVFPNPADGPGPRGMRFVLFQPDLSAWLKSDGHEIYLPLFKASEDDGLSSPKLWELAEPIVGAEVGFASWSLMHRFNLCHDLLEKAHHDPDALALLFVWLRYSATRHLDWQRRFNTQPRELSHAQQRLTLRLANLFRREESARMWTRMMLATLGRGGEGQRVRDEILHIMHRNHLKEISGTFIEEWHQKLHNNTTPDDVVICSAYLEFLKSNGDLGRFRKTLEAGGVTHERLKGFERPIKTDPEFPADKKDALLREFGNFLGILKSVHSGVDLESGADAARGRLGAETRQKLDGLMSARHRGAPLGELVSAATAVRAGLKEALRAAADDGAARDFLFLDLALDDFARGMIERQNLGQLDRDALAELVRAALRNLDLSIGSSESALCADHWSALLTPSARVPAREGADWALHAKSVADRAARLVQEESNSLYRRLQPKAEFLGEAFAVPAWSRALFSEEVIRGGPAFALAMLLRALDPLLRKAAGLGGWQVISPSHGVGRVCVVDGLAAVQGKVFQEDSVLVAGSVNGNEDIPEGVIAVITPDAPDLLSHVAVRARNGHVLFATCFDPAAYERLKGFQGKIVSIGATPGGDVETKEGGKMKDEKASPSSSGASAFAPPPSSPKWVVAQDEFTPEIVGGKSNNLNGLRGRLPDWIRLPTSLALPFGVFEKSLRDESNRAIRRDYENLIAELPIESLAPLRELVSKLNAPSELKQALEAAWRQVGLTPVPWERAWLAVKRVWASKWNERAFLSRRARGIGHDRLLMAVLVQQVVDAEYAFVIHTVNPLTGNRDEIFAEVVLGLGETLVGNYPGRAMGFVSRKADLAPRLISYPGKSAGLYGRGVIFRSDSNGEDLADFAGAGLYDSFLAEEPEHRLLDYRNEKLAWDADFRADLLRSIARIGIEVERVLGSAQDIEGAVSGGKFHVVQTRPQVGLSDSAGE